MNVRCGFQRYNAFSKAGHSPMFQVIVELEGRCWVAFVCRRKTRKEGRGRKVEREQKNVMIVLVRPGRGLRVDCDTC